MTATATVRYHDHHPRSASLCDEILAGFAATPKQTSPKHFYDAFAAGHADAALAASIFHYGQCRISDTKQYLTEQGIPVRRLDA